MNLRFPDWLQRKAISKKLMDLPIGARFRLKPDGPLWVLLDNFGYGLIVSWDGVSSQGEPLHCSAAESPEDLLSLRVYDVS